MLKFIEVLITEHVLEHHMSNKPKFSILKFYNVNKDIIKFLMFN